MVRTKHVCVLYFSKYCQMPPDPPRRLNQFNSHLLRPGKGDLVAPHPAKQCCQTRVSAILINGGKRERVIYICIFLIMPQGQESCLTQPSNLIYKVRLQSPKGILFYNFFLSRGVFACLHAGVFAYHGGF